MSARTYTRCLTAAQLQALADRDVVPADTTCTSPSLNTCERDANDLLAQYPLYDTTHGVYTEWGTISLSWEFENEPSDERWKVGRYVDEHGYRVGDQVLVIGNDGYLVTLYTATGDGPAPAGPFDPDLWYEVCHITTSTPVGLPDIAELRSLYGYFDPGTVYSENDIILLNTGCGDHTCAYIATGAVPEAPPTSPWSKLYCVPNGSPSRCRRQVVCGPGRTVVDLSGDGTDLICASIESTDGVGPFLS